MTPSGAQTANIFEGFLIRLRESRQLSVYEAIERFVQAADAAGYDADTLLQMLDQGMSFGALLELIESKMESQKAA